MKSLIDGGQSWSDTCSYNKEIVRVETTKGDRRAPRRAGRENMLIFASRYDFPTEECQA